MSLNQQRRQRYHQIGQLYWTLDQQQPRTPAERAMLDIPVDSEPCNDDGGSSDTKVTFAGAEYALLESLAAWLREHPDRVSHELRTHGTAA